MRTGDGVPEGSCALRGRRADPAGFPGCGTPPPEVMLVTLGRKRPPTDILDTILGCHARIRAHIAIAGGHQPNAVRRCESTPLLRSQAGCLSAKGHVNAMHAIGSGTLMGLPHNACFARVMVRK